MTTLFHCAPLRSAISRSACGARHVRKIGRTCAECTVGREHARGVVASTWPDGSAIVVRPVTPHTLASVRVHLAIIEAHDRGGWMCDGAHVQPRPGKIVGGKTVREAAREIGLETRAEAQVVWTRLARGEPPERALSPAPRVHDPRSRRVVWQGESMSIRAFAREIGRPYPTVRVKVARGLAPEAIARSA